MEYKDGEEVHIRKTGGFESGGAQSGKPFINSALVLYPGEFMLDVVEFKQALINYGLSTYFNWKGSSKLLFWRWSQETRALFLKGKPTFKCGRLHATKRQAQKPKALIYPFIVKSD